MTKTCTTCLVEKPLEDFHKSKANKLGRSPKCKACVKAYDTARYKKDPAPAKVRALEWSRANPNKRKVIAKKWADENSEKTKKTRLVYVALNKVKLIEYRQSYYIENREKMTAANIDWRGRNPAKIKIINANMRHRRRALIGQNRITQQEWDDLCDFYDHRCLCCDTPEADIVPAGNVRGLTMDHVIPLTKGGPHLISNTQPLCLYCNSSKNDKIADHLDYRGIFNFNLFNSF